MYQSVPEVSADPSVLARRFRNVLWYRNVAKTGLFSWRPPWCALPSHKGPAQGVTDQASLERWAQEAQFETHFQGKVKGLGYAVSNWLVIRQGVESIKPDVHVLRFVEKAIGRPVKETVAVEALVRAAKDLETPVHKLDWAIWEAGRGGAAA